MINNNNMKKRTGFHWKKKERKKERKGERKKERSHFH